MKRTSALGALVASALLAITAVAQQPPPVAGPAAGAPKLFGDVEPAQKIGDNLYLIAGGGGNSIILVRADGVLLVDTKLENEAQALLDEIRKVTNKPITHIVDTHMHADHAGGNPLFASAFPSAQIIAQENAKARMEKQPQLQKGGVPTRTYKDRLTLFSGKDAVDLYYPGPLHTDGDTFVVFREARVMQTGDVFPATISPRIDVAGGGNGLLYGETIAKAARDIKNVDRVVVGHGVFNGVIAGPRIVPWQDFVDYGEYARLFAAHARTAAAAGKTPEQALAEFEALDVFKPGSKFANYVVDPVPPGAMKVPGANFGVLYKELGK